MTEEYTLAFVGTLKHDKYLALDGRPFVDVIMEYLPLVSIVDMVKNFGEVDIKITFHDYDSCPCCQAIVRKNWICQTEEE